MSVINAYLSALGTKLSQISVRTCLIFPSRFHSSYKGVKPLYAKLEETNYSYSTCGDLFQVTDNGWTKVKRILIELFCSHIDFLGHTAYFFCIPLIYCDAHHKCGRFCRNKCILGFHFYHDMFFCHFYDGLCNNPLIEGPYG